MKHNISIEVAYNLPTNEYILSARYIGLPVNDQEREVGFVSGDFILGDSSIAVLESSIRDLADRFFLNLKRNKAVWTEAQ